MLVKYFEKTAPFIGPNSANTTRVQMEARTQTTNSITAMMATVTQMLLGCEAGCAVAMTPSFRLVHHCRAGDMSWR